jgi:hypothetical protein
VRHSRILRQQQRAAFNENQREAPQGGSSVLAVRRPISADPERLKIGCRKVRYRTDRIASEERYSIRDSPSPPTVPHELCSRAQLPCTPVVADSERAAYTARLFHFSEWTRISQNFNDRDAPVRPKERAGRVVTNPALTTAYQGG